jgi:lysylphosphatidylglycerol synthetase-like protein (DUF2156 family)
MLRCECQARLGRGWRFCEACGRPAVDPVVVAVSETGPVHEPASDKLSEPVMEAPVVSLTSFTGVSNVHEPAVRPKIEAQSIDHLDWRFGLAPVLLGAVLSLSLAWLSLWVIPVGAGLGGIWGWRRWRAIRRAMDGFTLEWVFEKVIVYGPCALGERAWWPTGVLYLTDQALKFKPFHHTNEREVSLDPVRLTGVDFPQRRSWPSDWRCVLVTSNYGPVFGIMKVFDRSLWEQHLKTAKQRALMPANTEGV